LKKAVAITRKAKSVDQQFSESNEIHRNQITEPEPNQFSQIQFQINQKARNFAENATKSTKTKALCYQM